MLDIYPDRITYFNKKHPAQTFVLMVASEAKDEIVLHDSNDYNMCKVIFFEPKQSIPEIIKNDIPEYSDIFFLHYKYSSKKPLNLDDMPISPTQRLIALADQRTTPVSLDVTKHFLDRIYQIDPNEFVEKIDDFFEKFGGHPNLQYYDVEYHTSAIVKMNSNCLWVESLAMLQPGEKHKVPIGELALVHDNFSNKFVPTLDMNGEITLHGVVILKVNEFRDSVFKQQEILFNQLVALKDHPVIASIEEGKIIRLKGCSKGSEVAIAALETLFEKDEQYRIIFELGIGLDSHLKLLSGNCNMNESYGGKDMCVHFGIGSLFAGHEFHLDILCPSTEIRAGDVTLLASQKIVAMKKRVLGTQSLYDK